MATTALATTLTGDQIDLDADVLAAFAATVRGQVIDPDHADYEMARHVWNGLIDKRPALIVRCTGTADVVAAIAFARAHNLLVAVRGGGHNVAGSAVVDGGLVIDLSPMKGIQVDPVRRTARVQAGATWGDVDHETQLHGLITPGGVVSTTGVAGFTLAGGMAATSRMWGLACDNLLAVEIVTADGQVRRASPTEHPDLFWGVRGGGGNFGVVTWFEFQLHALGPEVLSVTAVYPLADAGRVARAWRDYTHQAPDEVTTMLFYWSLPAIPDLPADLHGAPIVGIDGLYAGPPDEGEATLAPLLTMGDLIVDLGGRARYDQLQSAFDWAFPAGQYYYWKSLFIDDLSDTTIDAIVTLGNDRPTPETIFGLRHLGGATSQVPEDATAYGNRRSQYNLSLDAIWQDPGQTDPAIAWVRRAWSDMRARTGGGVYLNFAGLGEDNALLARAGHAGNYERLREVKRRYDPTNFFRSNINIAP
jgi:FAD/FMN-containing dehydrogenase